MQQIDTTAEFSNYRLEDTIEAELNNNLTLVNHIVLRQRLKCKPDFYILGGAALVFHGLNYKSTLDIDTANKISTNVKESISEFIDDGASEVAILPKEYRSRAVHIRPDLEAIDVFILGKEDLLITKLHCGRRKDFKAIHDTGIIKMINQRIFSSIVLTELDLDEQARINKAISYYNSTYGKREVE